ncbi:MAG TPA: hypothetical protein VHD35_08295 [Chitinophagaceae bacterium]|jgi:hypothetical protein|nr:hypothetical protein [Chitinophagaceae bacterium]
MFSASIESTFTIGKSSFFFKAPRFSAGQVGTGWGWGQQKRKIVRTDPDSHQEKTNHNHKSRYLAFK